MMITATPTAQGVPVSSYPLVDQDQEAVEPEEETEEEDEVWEEVAHPVPVSATVEVTLPPPLPMPVPAPKTARERGREEREERLLLHQAHLLCLIVAARHRDALVRGHPELGALACSLLPPRLHARLAGRWRRATASVSSDEGARAREELHAGFQELVVWWAKTFAAVQTADPDFLDVTALERAAATAGQALRSDIPTLESASSAPLPPSSSALLFVAACHALGIPCRLVSSLHPVPLSLARSTGMPKEVLADPKRPPIYPLRHWCEVQMPVSRGCEVEGRDEEKVDASAGQMDDDGVDLVWVCADPCLNVVGDYYRFDAPSTANHQVRLAYVLAFGDFWEDLTWKYTTNRKATQRLRIKVDTPEWAGVLEGLFHPVIPPPVTSTVTPSSSQQCVGEGVSSTSQALPPMPTTFKDFKDNDHYALDHNLNVNQIIHPRGPVHAIGSFRDIPVYPRASLHVAQAPEAWKRQGRCIKAGEEPLYYCMDPRTKKKMLVIREPPSPRASQAAGADTIDDADDGSFPSAYYGPWQTEPCHPDPIVDGVIPKNSFGNFELFHPCMLPAGAVHLDYKGIAKSAKKLVGVDFADAMLGFEWHGGRACPAVRGIVVADEHAESVLAAYHRDLAVAAERERAKRTKEVLARWKRVINGALIRANLMERYH